MHGSVTGRVWRVGASDAPPTPKQQNNRRSLYEHTATACHVSASINRYANKENRCVSEKRGMVKVAEFTSLGPLMKLGFWNSCTIGIICRRSGAHRHQI